MRILSIATRLVFCALVLACAALPAFAQPEEEGFTDDTLRIESGDTVNPDDTFFQDVENDDDAGAMDDPGFFRARGGFFGGPVVEFTSLKPEDLDPVLSGQLVIFGAEGYIILNSWLIGGAGVSAHLYDLSPAYDRFEYGYGGVLTGYDTKIFDGVMSLRGSVLIGAGGLEMLKKRTDLTPAGGNEILERFRDEGFFLLRPGASIGYSPLQFLEFRIGADYLLPFGGESVEDLRNLTYGFKLILGIGD